MPPRFKLTFGPWSQDTDELARAAADARQRLVQAVTVAMDARQLARGDPERVAYLILRRS
jgi:hypothetical protein